MALSRAFLCRPAPDYREQVRRYHDYLAETLEAFTVSEHAYALLGAATAFRAFGEAADRALAERAANLILSKLDPETGNIPAEHYEAPKGTHLVDTVYTVNWSFLALQMAAKLTGDAQIAAAKEKQLELLLSIQDRSESAFFHGCWRGCSILCRRMGRRRLLRGRRRQHLPQAGPMHRSRSGSCSNRGTVHFSICKAARNRRRHVSSCSASASTAGSPGYRFRQEAAKKPGAEPAAAPSAP